MSKIQKIALVFSVLVCSFLAMTLLIPVSAAPQSAPQSFAAPAVSQPDTTVIQVAYERPPWELQEATAEPQPEPTVEVTKEPGGDVIIVNPPDPKPNETSVNLLNLLYAVATIVLGGGGLVFMFDRLRNSKAALDAAEGIYEDNVTPEMQKTIRAAFEHIRDLSNKAFDLADKLTDGLPNSVDAQKLKDSIRDAQAYQPPPYPPDAPTKPGS